MARKHRTTVHLPHPYPSVELPEHLATPLQHIIDAAHMGVSTLDLQAAGTTAPASVVSRLKRLGAQIKSERREVVDQHGKTRKGIAHYIYAGWQAPLWEPELDTTPQGGDL